MGPWLATRDEIADPGMLEVLCKVGADLVAEDSTRYLTYSVPEVLAFAPCTAPICNASRVR
jgi:2,4-didehydro-3-deoxy-L-rhamnonate hydrolase